MALPSRLSNRTRIQMTPRARMLRGLVLLGRYNLSSAIPALGSHQHKGAIEICYLVRGRQTYSVGGRFYQLRGGDTYVTFPDEEHGTGGLPQEKGVLYWIIVKLPDGDAPFLGMSDPGRRTLIQALRTLPNRHFPGSWALRENLDGFARAYHEPDSPMRALALMNHLHACLLEVVQCARNPVRRRLAGSLAPVLDYVADHPHAPIPVPEMARMAGLSEARFKVRFKEETGVPPAEYVMRARVLEAERRLESGRYSVTRVAFDLGFSSSQYFATVFKRYTRKTPREVTRSRS